jgi:hypothetical protein
MQLIYMTWWEILPRFFRVAGAAIGATVITWLLVAPMRAILSAHELALQLASGMIWLQIFPIFLITNLVDSTFFPVRSLFGTVRRLAARVGNFAAFQTFAMLLTGLVLIAVEAMRGWHWAAVVTVAGPLAAAWLLYYGHWIGRLCRHLADVD